MTPTARILIIEDESIIARSLQRLLQRHGYVAITTSTVRMARQLVASDDFDLIIADLRLPDGLGTDILPMCAGIPMLVMSSHPNLEILRAAPPAGVTDYIAKPFGFDEMLAKVTDSLRAHAG